ncbi:MAG: proline--tRNA ligase [Planctomycetota bacterium]|nr:proline--tRNA ligase [Planctomycetota bacterium]
MARDDKKRDEKKITRRSEDYSQWYLDIVLRAEMADYSPVRGCMVIRPHGYAVWELIQKKLDAMFKETGHSNAYFPLFIPESYIEREKEHFEGFAPECAVVTEGGGKKLQEKLYIRPTSEMIVWSMYKKWIQSYRDLPILLNQWCNVVRWEMRTRLFLRTTEFLWQEGHTAHATEEEAREETARMLEIYRRFAEEVMAMPVLTGSKTANERFKGAVETFSIEAMMQDGKALQAGTSHYLGENFARAFDVTYQAEDNTTRYVQATSWGVSTRLVGALIMAHSDDQGLILPPALAPIQVVVVPIYRKSDEKERVLSECRAVSSELPDDVRVHVDDREGQSPGWKFNAWELKGVPLRIEVGPKDLEKGQLCLARRFPPPGTEIDGGRPRKDFLPRQEALARIPRLLGEMQKELFESALRLRESRSRRIDDLESFEKFYADEGGGFSHSHWCGSGDCELQLANRFKTTIRSIPFDAPREDGKCILCGEPSTRRVVFSQAY